MLKHATLFWKDCILPRRTVLAGAAACLIVLIINVIVTCCIAVFPKTDSSNAVLYRGSCSRVSNANLAAHLLLNIFGSLLLSASNYAMQLATAPTRKDVNNAHKHRRWLDIGVPSLRNLRILPYPRALCWALLLISSLPLHLIYNSSIFATQVASEYLVTELDESFLHTGASTRLPGLTETKAFESGIRPGTTFTQVKDVFESILANARHWDNFTLEHCASVYSTPVLTSHRTLVLIIPSGSTSENTLPGLFRVTGSDTWMCDEPPGVVAPDATDANGVAGFPCDPSTARFGSRRGDNNWQQPSEPIYCLAEPIKQACKLEANLYFFIVVCIANVIKTAVMTWMLFQLREPSLNTLGDAIASFMELPDDTTAGFSHYDAREFKPIWRQHRQPEPLPWHKRKTRRIQGLAPSRVVPSMISFIATIFATGALLGLAVHGDSRRGALSSSLSASGFTSKDYFAVIGFEALQNANLATIVLIVNLPQLVFSLLYFLYNSLLTGMLQASEWNSFALRPQQLRISDAPPGQRSTYWLQIPPRYAIPMMLFGIVMHWLISQSIYLSKVQFKNFDGEPSQRFGGLGYGSMYGEHPGEMLAAGYSSLGIMICLITGFVAFCTLLLIGLRRMKGDMVVASNCSAVIAAACHGSSVRRENPEREGHHVDDQRKVSKSPSETEAEQPDTSLMWGEVLGRVDHEYHQNSHLRSRQFTGPQTLGFSAGQVTSPWPGALYGGAPHH